VPEAKNRSRFQKVVISRILDDGKGKKDPVILCVIHHHQNFLESIILLFNEAKPWFWMSKGCYSREIERCCEPRNI
jgi:hypothetical protein